MRVRDDQRSQIAALRHAAAASAAADLPRRQPPADPLQHQPPALLVLSGQPACPARENSMLSPSLCFRLPAGAVSAPRSRRGALRCRAVAAPPAPAQAVEKELSTSRFDDAGITMRVLRRTSAEGAISYSVEVHSDEARPNLVLHWAVNDWELPPQVCLPGLHSNGAGAVAGWLDGAGCWLPHWAGDECLGAAGRS